MLPRLHRLTRSSDIQAIIRQGRVVRTKYCSVYTAPGAAKNHMSRVACVVGKKVHAQAVRRHKYQRWLRVVSKEVLSRTSPPLDLVFLGHPALKQAENFQDFKQSLAGLADQLNHIQ